MSNVAAHIELKSRRQKFEALSKVRVTCLEVWRHVQEEVIALYSCSPSHALRKCAEPVCRAIRAPAPLAPPLVQRLASRCARNARRELKVPAVSDAKGWQRIGRSNTMRQLAQNPECSSEEAELETQIPIRLVAGQVFLGLDQRAAGHGAP